MALRKAGGLAWPWRGGDPLREGGSYSKAGHFKLGAAGAGVPFAGRQNSRGSRLSRGWTPRPRGPPPILQGVLYIISTAGIHQLLGCPSPLFRFALAASPTCGGLSEGPEGRTGGGAAEPLPRNRSESNSQAPPSFRGSFIGGGHIRTCKVLSVT